jgi:hypothetical protein
VLFQPVSVWSTEVTEENYEKFQDRLHVSLINCVPFSGVPETLAAGEVIGIIRCEFSSSFGGVK